MLTVPESLKPKMRKAFISLFSIVPDVAKETPHSSSSRSILPIPRVSNSLNTSSKQFYLFDKKPS